MFISGSVRGFFTGFIRGLGFEVLGLLTGSEVRSGVLDNFYF